MNKNELRVRMTKYGDTQKDLASQIGISLSRFNAKLNCTGGAEFTQSEILSIAKRYNLSSEEVCEIFFDSKVS